MKDAKVLIKSNNKLKVAVAVLSLALILAVGAVVGVFAAMQQNIGTRFSVSYTIGSNVGVAVGAVVRQKLSDEEYWFSDSYGLSTDNDEPNLYVLDAIRENMNISLEGPDITFSDDYEQNHDYNEILICFYFKNLSNEDSITVNFYDNCTIENMIVQYHEGTVESTSSDDLTVYNIGSYYPDSGSSSSSYSMTVEPGEIGCILIDIYCYNPNLSGTYESTSSGGILFTITK